MGKLNPSKELIRLFFFFGTWKLNENGRCLECENYILYKQGLDHFNKIKMWCL